MEIKNHSDFNTFLKDINFLKLDGILASLKVSEWRTHSVVLGELSLQYGWAGGGAIINGKLNGDGNLVQIPLNGSCKVNGKKLLSDSVLVCVPDVEYIISFNDVHDWMNLFIPLQVVQLILKKNTISENNHPNGVVHVGNDTVLKFKKILQEIFDFVEKANDQPKGMPSNGKVQKEILAIYESITLQPTVIEQTGVGRPIINRTQIMLLIKNKLQTQSLDNLFIEDLAEAANVSGRTLRKIFMEYFGISPLKYLTIYKMNAARMELQNSDPTKATVSNIAAKFGFWHFGRFASGYRNLFGERPLDTLNNGHKKTNHS
ncbi:MAG: helix-turn-helix domain-containing protein [Planctomycetes bacterium]|nr:helix-turn-helix domain-containing protein [Planctomycetota bacterium]